MKKIISSLFVALFTLSVAQDAQAGSMSEYNMYASTLIQRIQTQLNNAYFLQGVAEDQIQRLRRDIQNGPSIYSAMCRNPETQEDADACDLARSRRQSYVTFRRGLSRINERIRVLEAFLNQG